MFERVNVLGVGVSAINIAMAVQAIARWITEDARQYVCVTGVHGIMESQRDDGIRLAHNVAGLVTPDGMPLVWLLKLAGFPYADRVYGPDLMLSVFERAQQYGCRHFLYGSTEQTLARLRSNLTQRFPRARIVGCLSPPFRPLSADEDRDIVATINDSGAHIVWIGLSTPKQERWMAQHRDALSANVLIGVGAAFDFNAGVVRQAPRFVQRSGFEWLFRLCMEPRRLWRRYLTNNPRFVLGIIMQKFGLRRYPQEWPALVAPTDATATRS